MIVVSNTSPLNYLILVQAVDLLPTLFGQVHVPEKVVEELSASGSPAEVRQWARQLPPWAAVRAPAHPDADLRLHEGEIHAISLAEELEADLLLIDDRRGTAAAKSRGLAALGLLGILDTAAARHLIDLPSTLDALDETNFRMTAALRSFLLTRHAGRSSS